MKNQFAEYANILAITYGFSERVGTLAILSAKSFNIMGKTLSLSLSESYWSEVIGEGYLIFLEQFCLV